MINEAHPSHIWVYDVVLLYSSCPPLCGRTETSFFYLLVIPHIGFICGLCHLPNGRPVQEEQPGRPLATAAKPCRLKYAWMDVWKLSMDHLDKTHVEVNYG